MLSLQMEITRHLFIKNSPVQVWTGSLRLHEVEALRISRQSAYGGGQIVSPTHRPPLSARKHT